MRQPSLETPEGKSVVQFLMRTDQPYRGHVEAHLLADETVAYSGGQTVAEYQAIHGYPLRIIEEAELEALSDAFLADCVTAPELIDEERFDDALNCLPPCRWNTVRGVNMFHISERITHNLVNWYAKLNGQYWRFVDFDNRPGDELAAKVAAAAQA